MEDKRMFNDEELDMVVGGVESERDVVIAFAQAEYSFKSIAEGASSCDIANKNEVCEAAYGMAGICSRYISGGMSIADAKRFLQDFYDEMVNPPLAMQKVFGNLKSAIGW